MRSFPIKTIFFISIFKLLFSISEALAETNKSPACEFNNYDGDVGEQEVINAITYTFMAEAFPVNKDEKNPKFEKLDSILNKINNQACKLQDGRPALNFESAAFKKIFKDANRWDLMLSKIQDLKKAHPNAPYTTLAEAEYWIEYAWSARGYGFASSVTPEGLKLFNERLNKAKLVLVNNKEIGSTSPSWYSSMMEIEMGLNSPQEEQEKYFTEGVTRYKTFLPLYISRRNSMEPDLLPACTTNLN